MMSAKISITCACMALAFAYLRFIGWHDAFGFLSLAFAIIGIYFSRGAKH